MNLVGKGLLVAAVVGLFGGAVWMVNAATAPYFASAKARALAERKIEELGGGELLYFDHFRDENYRAIYRRDGERYDIHVESGKVRVQTGLPLCKDAASR